MTTNIGRDDTDKSYRYKMPKLQTKIEGRGNGIKTVIPNMSDIARALHTDPGYPTKFFGIELGAQSKYDTKRDVAIVNGAHGTGDLVTLLDKFIDQFILCPKCRLPEIMMEVKPKSGHIKIDCRACGNNVILKTTHKLTTYILNNPPAIKKGVAADKDFVNQQKAEKKGGKKDKDDAGSPADGSDADEEESKQAAPVVLPDKEVEWFTDTSAAAVEKRKAAEMDEMRASAKVEAILSATNNAAAGPESPGDVLRGQIAAGRTVSEVQAELRRLQLSRGFNDQQRLAILVEALVDPTQPVKQMLLQLKQHAKHLAPLSQGATAGMVLMGAVELLVVDKAPGLAEKMDVLVKVLYDSDILTEEQVVAWYESPAEASLLPNKKQALDLRKNAKRFVDWLRTAEEESDDD